jgi:hypothetical protein
MLQTYQQKTERRIQNALWSERVTNAETRQRNNMKDNVTVAHNQVEMRRTGGKNGPAHINTRYIDVGRSKRQKEKCMTEDPTSRHVQVSSWRTMVTSSQKTGAHGVNSYKICKTNVIYSVCHKQKVATPLYLVKKVPTYQNEAKAYYMLQVSKRHRLE